MQGHGCEFLHAIGSQTVISGPSKQTKQTTGHTGKQSAPIQSDHKSPFAEGRKHGRVAPVSMPLGSWRTYLFLPVPVRELVFLFSSSCVRPLSVYDLVARMETVL
jgi:hypothetical protein